MSQIICFDCKKEVPEYNAIREVFDDEKERYVWKNVKICKHCKINEQLGLLEKDYSTEYIIIHLNNLTVYKFNLKDAKLVLIEYDPDIDGFLVTIEYSDSYRYIVEYDFNLNPVRVM